MVLSNFRQGIHFIALKDNHTVQFAKINKKIFFHLTSHTEPTPELKSTYNWNKLYSYIFRSITTSYFTDTFFTQIVFIAGLIVPQKWYVDKCWMLYNGKIPRKFSVWRFCDVENEMLALWKIFDIKKAECPIRYI